MKRALHGLIISLGIGFIILFHFWIEHYQNTLTVVLGSADPMDIVVYGFDQTTLQEAQELLLKQGYGEGVYHFVREQVLWNPLSIGMMLCFMGMIMSFIGYVLYDRKLMKQKEEKVLQALEVEGEASGNKVIEKINDLKKKYQTVIRTIVLDQDSQNQELENIAHQMKSTLSTILLNVDQICDEENEQEVQTIIHQVDRCNEMLNRFLEGHEVRSNMSNYHYEVKNMAECVQHSIQRVSLALEEKNLKIEENLVDCVLSLDAFWIEEAIETILLNAIDFAYKDTSILVQMKKEEDHIQIIILNQGDEPKDIHSIFMRYGSTRKQSEHFGIGLHMVKTVCRNHLGDIKAYYESNEMKFVLDFPLNHLESIQYIKA